ncbi:hypothetical protein BKA62DRAFT_367561 [Auriculariales sp. MPI-PUGE-AT-0066]|nr:hypothetical protein BKA62DRAFT_367561 [Auriculariales sp. MPI-PUGE-AT-0066]
MTQVAPPSTQRPPWQLSNPIPLLGRLFADQAPASAAKRNPWVRGMATTAVTTGVIMVASPLILPVFGFTTGGIAAGSTAAGWQSAIGNVAGGSLFAVLQSAGAVGGFALTTAITAGAGVGGTLGAALAVSAAQARRVTSKGP